MVQFVGVRSLEVFKVDWYWKVVYISFRSENHSLNFSMHDHFGARLQEVNSVSQLGKNVPLSDYIIHLGQDMQYHFGIGVSKYSAARL